MTQVFQWLNNLNCAIYFLQVTHSTEITAKRWENEWPEKCFVGGASSNSEGVAILIHPDCNIDIVKQSTVIDEKLFL